MTTLSKCLRLAIAISILASCTIRKREPLTKVEDIPSSSEVLDLRADEGEPLTHGDLASNSVDQRSVDLVGLSDQEPSEKRAPWQKNLDDEVAALERRSDRFLQKASDLYDVLLEEQAVRPTAEKLTVIRNLAKSCAESYKEVILSFENLNQSLQKPEIKSALPLQNDRAKEVYAALLKDLALWALQGKAFQPTTYDPWTLTADKSILQKLFADGDKIKGGDSLKSLSQSQRDALLLLDYMRVFASNVTSVSSVVDGWVNVRERDVSGSAETLAH